MPDYRAKLGFNYPASKEYADWLLSDRAVDFTGDTSEVRVEVGAVVTDLPENYATELLRMGAIEVFSADTEEVQS